MSSSATTDGDCTPRPPTVGVWLPGVRTGRGPGDVDRCWRARQHAGGAPPAPGLGIAPSDVERIVVTHYHLDHRGALNELQRATGASVLVHSSEAPFFRGEQR